MFLKVIKQKLISKPIRRGHYYHNFTHSHKLILLITYTHYCQIHNFPTITTDYVIQRLLIYNLQTFAINKINSNSTKLLQQK